MKFSNIFGAFSPWPDQYYVKIHHGAPSRMWGGPSLLFFLLCDLFRLRVMVVHVVHIHLASSMGRPGRPLLSFYPEVFDGLYTPEKLVVVVVVAVLVFIV